MERRDFLKYTGLAGIGFAFAACRQNSPPSSSSSPNSDFGKLEKTYLTLGYVPGIDAAPLIIAKEKGFFARYGLTVGFSRQSDWEAIEEGLLEGRFDASQALFAMPMSAQLGAKAAPMVSLMMLNLNGSAITLAQKTWQADIRPVTDYANIQEFADAWRKYILNFENPPVFALESSISMDSYLYRYWLASMGINPEQEVELTEIAPGQMFYKLQAGIIQGYCGGEPWNQQAVLESTGFIVDVNRNIWKGHPGKVLATMQSWADENPTTARALVAALLEACRFCDQPENRQTVAQILAQSNYLNTNLLFLEPSLTGKYNFGGFDQKNRLKQIPDFNLFHFLTTDYLKKPNHANYPWRSHAVWLLTQMIRWNQIDQQEYPKDADTILDKIYPLDIYEDAAKALSIELPKDRMKIEPATVFIDQREFDPTQPVAYLNQFTIRANRNALFAVK